MKDKITYIVSLSVLIIVIAFVLVSIGMLLCPAQVIDFKTDKYKILTPVVKAGESVKFHAEFEKLRPQGGTVNRQLIDSIIYFYPEARTDIPVGYYDVDGEVTIPSYVDPGIYYIRNIYTYKINLIKTITYTMDTETFEVTNGD